MSVIKLQCAECNEPMNVTSKGTSSTYVGYISPSGHDHDDNCISKYYYCENGHKCKVSVQRKCTTEGCGWVGKKECSCCGGIKFKEWPEVLIYK